MASTYLGIRALFLPIAILLTTGFPFSVYQAGPDPTPAMSVIAINRYPMRRGNLSGTIVEQQSGSIVAGASVTILDSAMQTTSDAHGHFDIAGIDLAADSLPITIIVSAAGHGIWTMTNARLIVSDTLIVDVQLGQDATQINLPDPEMIARWQVDQAETAATNTGIPRLQQQPSYNSQTTPPPTIRVRVTGVATCNTSVPYQVKTIDFRDYAKHVLPNEWIASWASESLKAGAMAVKTYAWYWVNRGGKWSDADVYDSTCDQVYNPAVSYASTNAAVDAAWNQRMVSAGLIFQASYRAYYTQCPGSANPGCMGQWDSRDLATAGWVWQDILRHFYSNIDILPTGDTTPPEQIAIDAPTNGATISGTLSVDGWARDLGAGMNRVEIWLDGGFLGNATYGLSRPDHGGNVGYHWQTDSSIYPDGPHGLLVQFYDLAGNHDVLTRTVQFDNRPVTGLIAVNSSPTVWGRATRFTALSMGGALTYTWSFGDTSGTNGAMVNHTYLVTGTYIAIVTATNGVGSLAASTTVTVVVETPVQTSITLAGGTLVFTDVVGNSTVVEIPSGAVSETITLVYTPLVSVTVPAGLAFAGHAFDLNAIQDEVLLPAYKFSVPVTLSIAYSDDDVAGLDRDTLALAYGTGSTWVDGSTTCNPASTYIREPDLKRISLAVCQLGQFSLFGSSHEAYLPLVVNGLH